MTMTNGWGHLAKPVPGISSVSVHFESMDALPESCTVSVKDGAWVVGEDADGNELGAVLLPVQVRR